MPYGCHRTRHETGINKWLELNTKYSEIWPNITEKKNHLKTTINIKMKKINLKSILKKTFKKKAQKKVKTKKKLLRNQIKNINLLKKKK